MLLLFWNGSGTVAPVVTTPTAVGRGRQRKERLLARIDGRDLYFDSIEEIEGYLASLGEEKLEQAEKQAEKVYAGTVKLVGDAPEPPQITIARAAPEVRAAVEEANALIRARYIQIMLELNEEEENEDLLMLL